MESHKQNEPGTLMRGPDDALYFIPDSALEAYKLSGEVAEEVTKKGIFDRQILGIARSPRDVGLSASNEPTQTVLLNLSALKIE